MSMLQQKTEITAEAMRAAPPVTVVGASLAGFGLNDVVLGLTVVYLALQIGYLLWKWRRHAAEGKPPKADE